MGEFADYAVDEAMEAENLRWLYRQGSMSDLEALDLGIIDHEGMYNHRPMLTSSTSPLKTCRHCGKTGLIWKQTDRGWRLHGAGGIHSCF